MDLTYNERGDILRTIDHVMADTGGTRFFDRAYTLDALGRVLGETRGDWGGSAIGTTREDRNWALTAMGNWASRDYDLDGLGTDFAEDNTPVGTHFNNANEWIKRNITTGGGPVDPLYDANGNLTDDDKDYVYTYDVWNRLTSIRTTGGSPTLVAEYRYNGLGQRIAEGDGTDTEHLMYDDRWRLISRHDGTSYTEEFLYHHAGLDGFGGASDVDSVIMRRTFLASGTPQTEDKRWYVLQNWRQDPAVTISDAGVQRERAFFSPYGRVFGVPAGDVSFEGAFGSGDGTTISGWSTAYRAHADVNLDGTINAADATGNTHATLGWDALSRDGSTIGYAGYVQDSSIPTLSHVRHRAYKSDLGRWVQRDPAGYVDGASLYEYVMSQPVEMRDPMGLASGVGIGGSCGGSVGFDSCGGGTGSGTPPPTVQPGSSLVQKCSNCCGNYFANYVMQGVMHQTCLKTFVESCNSECTTSGDCEAGRAAGLRAVLADPCSQKQVSPPSIRTCEEGCDMLLAIWSWMCATLPTNRERAKCAGAAKAAHVACWRACHGLGSPTSDPHVVRAWRDTMLIPMEEYFEDLLLDALWDLIKRDPAPRPRFGTS